MNKYEQIQTKYAKLLPVMIAILSTQNAIFEIKLIQPQKSI